MVFRQHGETWEQFNDQPKSEEYMAAALATSRTAAQMTSRMRDIADMVEVNFRLQQRAFLSEVTSESAHAFEAQRHSLVQDASVEMMRRDAHSAQ